MRYITGMEDTMCSRVVMRSNWPDQGDVAYAAVPFDLEQNVCLEEKGILKVKTGVISPHPTDPGMCLLTGCDLVNLGMVPKWGLGFLLKKMTLPAIASQTAKYKTWLAANS